MLDHAAVAVAAAVLPAVDWSGARVVSGGSHTVVLADGIAAVRIARDDEAAAAMPRRIELLRHLADAGLPFATPVPLTDVIRIGAHTAMGVSFVDGVTAWGRDVEPRGLRTLFDAIGRIDVDAVRPLLDVPHCYAGGARWADIMAGGVVDALPPRWRGEASARVEAALALPPVPERVVHGDLAGTNVFWDAGEERCLGIIDWDFAQPFDSAVDAACLGWFGWDNMKAAVDADTHARALTWAGTFGLEQLARALIRGQTDLGPVVDATVEWLRSARS